MRKHLMTGLVIVAASFSVGAMAASGNITSGNIGSGAFGTDNFLQAGMSGSNPGTTGTGPGGFGATMNRIFNGGMELHFDVNGLLVDSNGTPFTGTAPSGDKYKDGKKL